MKLSIVIPCYNEGKNIKTNIENILLPVLRKYSSIHFEVILVNDGSKDNTLDEINSIKGVIPISYSQNRGKGYAVKQGLMYAKGDYILFMDADISTNLCALDSLFELIKEDYGMIIASRYMKGSILPVKSPLSRRIITTGCRLLTKIMFLFNVHDTQCGFKAIRKDLVKILIEKSRITNYAFDIEYLYIAKLNKYTIKEFPVTWINGDKSSVSPIKSSIKFFIDIFKIRRNKKYYLN